MSAYPNQEVNFVLLLMSLNRRQFIYLLGATLGTATLASLKPPAFAATGSYGLIALPYSYDALEPYIDKETMNFITINTMLPTLIISTRQWQNIQNCRKKQ